MESLWNPLKVDINMCSNPQEIILLSFGWIDVFSHRIQAMTSIPKKMTQINIFSIILVSVRIISNHYTMKTLNLFICLHMILDSDGNKHRSNHMHGIIHTDLQHYLDSLHPVRCIRALTSNTRSEYSLQQQRKSKWMWTLFCVMQFLEPEYRCMIYIYLAICTWLEHQNYK